MHNNTFPRTIARRAFTLVELLVVMAVIAILTSLILAALYSAQETARIDKTKGTIHKINTLLARHLDEIRTAKMPVYLTQGELAANASDVGLYYAAKQLLYRWQTQRIELPDRYEDIAVDGMLIAPENTTNALRLAYQIEIKAKLGIPINDSMRPRMADVAEFREQNQSAECLYLVVTRGLIADDEMQFFDHEVGDEDGDGMFEFIDGWGQPIEFLRWAPGYTPQNDAVSAMQYSSTTGGTNPDFPDTTFDPLGVGLPSAPAAIRQHPTFPTEPPGPGTPATWGFKLYPLVVSPGPDGEYGVFFASDFNVSEGGKNNNPYSTYLVPSTSNNFWRGTPVAESTSEGGGHLDNITNHENLGGRR